MMLTATAEKSYGSGAEDGPGVAEAGGEATLNATSGDMDAVGAGGRHVAENWEWERFDSWGGNPASKSSGVGDIEGGPEAFRVAENPRGDRQGVGGGVELPSSTDNPRLEDLP